MSLIPNINLNSSQEGSEFLYKEIHDKCFVHLDQELQLPPTAMGIGYHDYKGQQYLNNTFSYGEFSAIVAASKTKKTFFKSALIAAYIGGNTMEYFPNFKSRREGEPIIIDIDTEQGSYYAQRAFRRVAEMVGASYNNYLPFGVEELNNTEIIQFIEGLMQDPRYKGKVKWMSIDGLADLVDNTNDIEKSLKVAQKLKKWRRENNMHINTVIHRNSTTDKATGHLGSFVQKKAETVILLKDTEENPRIKNSPIEVVQTYSRGVSFDPFHFKLNDETLPHLCKEADQWA
jgi:hypothetical protein